MWSFLCVCVCFFPLRRENIGVLQSLSLALCNVPQMEIASEIPWEQLLQKTDSLGSTFKNSDSVVLSYHQNSVF